MHHDIERYQHLPNTLIFVHIGIEVIVFWSKHELQNGKLTLHLVEGIIMYGETTQSGLLSTQVVFPDKSAQIPVVSNWEEIFTKVKMVFSRGGLSRQVSTLHCQLESINWRIEIKPAASQHLSIKRHKPDTQLHSSSEQSKSSQDTASFNSKCLCYDDMTKSAGDT